MATIQNSIAISDGATAPLQRMARAAEVTTGRFESASAAANRIETSVSGATARNVSGIASAAYSTVPAFEAASVAATGTATSVGLIGAASAAARAGIIGLGATMVTAFGGIVAVLGLITAAIQSIMGAIHLSDEFSQTTARLTLMNDGLQTTAQLQQEIFQSAQRSRGAYQITADAVSKLGMQAKDAFSSTAEIIDFAEQLNKTFVNAGTSAVGVESVMLQLTQSMAAGRLQGEELNAVLDNAQPIVANIAKYMGVPVGQIKQMASDGQITAEIIKKAMFAAADETNRKFETIPKTWGNVWTSFKNIVLMGLQPLYAQISVLANNQGIQALFNNLATGISYAGAMIAGLINNLLWLNSVFNETGAYISSWLSASVVIGLQGISAITPIVLGAILGLATGWAVLNAGMLYNAVTSAMITTYVWGQVAAITIVNAVISAYRWLVLALAAAKVMWAIATNGATTAQVLLAAATWLVTAPISAVAALILGAMVAALTVWGLSSINLRDVFAGVMDFMIDACQTGVNTMVGLINGLVDVINQAANGLNSLFGTNIGMVEHVSTVNFQGAKRWSGYVREGTLMQNLTGEVGGMLGLPQMPNPNNYSAGFPAQLSGVAAAGQNTADNTKSIMDAMEITEESLEYMRDIAEQEVVNRYTTASVKIDVGGVHNSVSSDTDIDGMVQYLSDSLFEAMVSGAEKVHV